MLTVTRLMDQLGISKFMRPLFNSPFLQPRVAEADRVMSELTLPPLRPTRRVKKNRRTGKPAHTIVDPRRRKGHKNMRDLGKVLKVLDSFLNPNLGPRLVNKQNDVKYVHIGSSDEEANIRAHPQGWMGRELVQPEFDKDIKLVNPINFMKPSGGFGDQPGDKEKYDEEGKFKVVKIEPGIDDDTRIKICLR